MKDRSKIISFTTTCAMLVLMACIGLYYMQYDYDASSYIKAFGYLVMTASSIVALANKPILSSLSSRFPCFVLPKSLFQS